MIDIKSICNRVMWRMNNLPHHNITRLIHLLSSQSFYQLRDYYFFDISLWDWLSEISLSFGIYVVPSLSSSSSLSVSLWHWVALKNQPISWPESHPL